MAGCCCQGEIGHDREGGDEGETQRWGQKNEESRYRNRAAEADGLSPFGQARGAGRTRGGNLLPVAALMWGVNCSATLDF